MNSLLLFKELYHPTPQGVTSSRSEVRVSAQVSTLGHLETSLTPAVRGLHTLRHFSDMFNNRTEEKSHFLNSQHAFSKLPNVWVIWTQTVTAEVEGTPWFTDEESEKPRNAVQGKVTDLATPGTSSPGAR